MISVRKGGDHLNERIKKLRKALGLTQQEFAERLNIGRGTLANYEVGRNEPIDAVIALICKEFNVNDEWLRTGEGGDAAMFVQRSEEDELAAAVDRLKIGQSAEFKRRLVVALSTLKEEHWLLLEEKLKEILGTREATRPSTTKLYIAARDGSRTEVEVDGDLTIPDESDEIP